MPATTSVSTRCSKTSRDTRGSSKAAAADVAAAPARADPNQQLLKSHDKDMGVCHARKGRLEMINLSKMHMYDLIPEALRTAYELGMADACPGDGSDHEHQLADLERLATSSFDEAVTEAEDELVARGRIEGAFLAGRLTAQFDGRTMRDWATS